MTCFDLFKLQVLPVWIVKKIFNYLDAKTLKKIKNVNSYWAYIVMEIAEEKKAMKFINKHIKKSEVTQSHNLFLIFSVLLFYFLDNSTKIRRKFNGIYKNDNDSKRN